MTHIPATLDAYLSTVVTPTLERQRKGGALAVKMEMAYLRALDFGDATAADARRIYAKYARSGRPTRTEYKTLEDYLFHAVSREAGRLGVAVHIHMSDGGGGFYPVAGSDPLLMEPAFNDTTLRGTNFVIIHGGGPFLGTREFHGEQAERLPRLLAVATGASAVAACADPARVAQHQARQDPVRDGFVRVRAGCRMGTRGVGGYFHCTEGTCHGAHRDDARQ
jgi:hypothetical protein